LKGIIIVGSKESVYDEAIDWIKVLLDFIRMIYKDFKHIKLLGVCFGSQAIAKALDGVVEPMK